MMTIYSQAIMQQTIISNAIKVLYLINLGFLHDYKKSLTELMKWFKS